MTRVFDVRWEWECDGESVEEITSVIAEGAEQAWEKVKKHELGRKIPAVPEDDFPGAVIADMELLGIRPVTLIDIP